jgi:hypothetical protein
MQTRSQTKYEALTKYEVNIDFDGASKAWKANKKSIGNGQYKYISISTFKSTFKKSGAK